MSPSAPRSATKSPRVRTASPQARRVITLDSYEESKGEDAEAEVARLEAQLAEARRRAYEKRRGSRLPLAESPVRGIDTLERVVARARGGPIAVPRRDAAAAGCPRRRPRRRPSCPRTARSGGAGREARKLAEEKAERVTRPFLRNSTRSTRRRELFDPAQARIKAEAEAKAAEERRLAREAEDETNGADPETVYCSCARGKG